MSAQSGANPIYLENIKLPFGVSENTGKIVHISEVSSGLTCECICPSCKGRLEAHKGKVKAHHFHHHGHVDCNHAFESALHLFAKELLVSGKELLLPKVVVSRYSLRRDIFPEKFIKFDKVELEKRVGNIIPDVIGTLKNHKVFIEFAVTHKCDDLKVKKIRDSKIAAVEIDLKGIDWECDRKSVETQILVKAPRYWLYNPIIDEAIEGLVSEYEDIKINENREKKLNEALKIKEKREKEQKEKREKERKEKQKKEALQKKYEKIAHKLIVASEKFHDIPHVTASHTTPKWTELFSEIQRCGFMRLTNIPVRGSWAFKLGPPYWQSDLILNFIQPRTLIDRVDSAFLTTMALEWLQKRGALREEFNVFVEKETLELVQKDFPDFDSPFFVVRDYLEFLQESEMLEKCGASWQINYHFF